MNPDSRDSIYKDLHGGQLSRQEAQNAESARRILSILFEYFRPASIVDVGCGLGSWLAVAGSMHVDDVQGLEGSWLDLSKVCVDPAKVSVVDLEQGFSLGRKFDLAICLEVAEHLHEASADRLVASLAAHADVVLFSAAIPHQGGHHHVNEQFPAYWAARFARLGFAPLDFIRPRIWDDEQVLWWLKQNTLVFAHHRVIAANESFRRESAIARPLSLVHPIVYSFQTERARKAQAELDWLVKFLLQGGTFVAGKDAEGNLTLHRS